MLYCPGQNDYYIKSHKFIQFTDGVPVTLSGKMSFYQLIRLCKAKLLGQDTGLGDSCYKNIDVQQALTEFGTTVMRRVSFSS